MESWLAYLKEGLCHKLPRDRIAGSNSYSGIMNNLKKLWPFLSGTGWKGKRQMAEDRRWLLLK